MTVDRLLRFLASRGHLLDLLCTVPSPGCRAGLREALGTVCRQIDAVLISTPHSLLRTAATLPGPLPMQVQYYLAARVRRRLAHMVCRESYDAVYTHLIRMAEYTRGLRLPKVLGMQVSQALSLRRLAEHARDPLQRLLHRIELAKVRGYEATVAADFDRVVLCGQADIEELRRTRDVENAVVCPHGQDIPPAERLLEARKVRGSVVLSGVMSTYANVEAATRFARHVFPLVERERPQARLWIVGREPSRSVLALARQPRVLVTGEVPDVEDWLLRAEVAVAPMRIAAGMQNKVVQAMACGLPVVATRVANEGIGGIPGRHLLVADDAESTARAVSALLADPELRARLGAAAREFAVEHWSWERHFGRLEALLCEVAGNPGAVARPPPL